MNGYERIQAVLAGNWPDQRPIMLHNFMLATREAGMTMRQYYTSAKHAARAHIQAVETYDLDGILLDIDTAVLAAAIGVGIDYPEDAPARAHKPCLSSLEQVPDLEPVDISRNERVQVALGAAGQLKQYFGDEVFLRGNCDQAPFSLASMMRSPAGWMMDLILNPEGAFQLLDYCTEVCLQFIRLMAAQGVHMISNGDSPAGPDMISPKMYRTFALPYEKKLVELSHELGLPYMLHICGDTSRILDAMPDTGLDAIELDYKTNSHQIHERYKDTIVLSGTIDPSGVIANGSTDDVTREAEALLTLFSDTPRFIMNAGCAIPPTTPPANIRKLIAVTRGF